MTSDFDEFMAGAFDDSAGILGTVAFTIAGMNTADAPFAGVLDRHTKGLALQEEGGGLIADLAATIVAKKSQFPAKPANNARLTVEGIAYEIADVEDDAICYTLRLRNPVN